MKARCSWISSQGTQHLLYWSSLDVHLKYADGACTQNVNITVLSCICKVVKQLEVDRGNGPLCYLGVI